MRASLRGRIFNGLSVGGFDACWWWQGDKSSDGYGRIWLNGRTQYVHRAMYEEFVGVIPEGAQIDHLCRHPACANPSHLEIVTPRENTLRGYGPTAVNARKTHCLNGHEYTPENTRYQGNNRYCRTCQRDWAYKRYWEGRERQRSLKIKDVAEVRTIHGRPSVTRFRCNDCAA